MRGLLATSVLVLALTACGGPPQEATPVQETPVPTVAPLELEGWQPTAEPRAYGADSLWEYINGAADQFVASGFEELEVRGLRRDDLEVEVQLYDMGTPLNAWGIFRTETVGREPLDIAAGAVVSPPYQAQLAAGPVYAKVEVREGELDEEAGRELLRALATALPGPPGRPAELAALPTDGRVDGSLGYTRSGLLGLGELERTVHARYELDGIGEVTAFLMLPARGGSVDDLWSGLAGGWQERTLAGRTTLTREVPYSGLVGMVRTEQGLLGVAGAEDAAQLETAFQALLGEG